MEGKKVFQRWVRSYSSSVSIDGDIPSTPMEDVFDSLAAGRDKHMKHGEKSKSYVARKLNFNSGDKERASDSGFGDGTVMESVYESILDGIISKEAEDILSEIVAADVLMTPPSAPRLSGIAKTCPGAPSANEAYNEIKEYRFKIVQKA